MQRAEFEKFCKELIELHRERMYNLEMQFLQAKHGLKRGMWGATSMVANTSPRSSPPWPFDFFVSWIKCG